MQDTKLRSATEADIETALSNASFAHWPEDEVEMLEIVNLVLDQLQGDPAPTGAAADPYRFLSRVQS